MRAFKHFPKFIPGTSDVLKTNRNGQTMAMIYADVKIIPPPEWHHDPTLLDSRGFTVAMLLGFYGIIPPKEWEHAPTIIEPGYKSTVAMHLARHRIIPPLQW